VLAAKNIHDPSHKNSVWFPPRFVDPQFMLCYVLDSSCNQNITRPVPRYPVYIISKGRWESRLTSKLLEDAKVPYKIVVEPSEYENYVRVIDPKKVLKLPENFSTTKQWGSTPARNWVWNHAKKAKYKRHWILDDNIVTFFRFNKNRRFKCLCVGSMFAAAEDFVDRFENVAMAGFHDLRFVIPGKTTSPIMMNTRVYSCILLQNNIPFKWEDKYNEDTDLSLRILKNKKYTTLLFHTFVMEKARTMTMKGGNTDVLYKDGRWDFAVSLQQKHPDVATVVQKYGRWHHHVDYRPFKSNVLKLKKPCTQKSTNNYCMILVKCKKFQRRG